METEESLEETEEKKRFRELLYSSLLQQRQENETNRIKIALVAVGATIAGVAGTIKALEPFSNPLLLLFILVGGYSPWLYLLYVLFKKLKVDEGVIDDKIDRMGTEMEGEDPPSKKCADELEDKFHNSLTLTLVGILFIPTCILISTLFIGEKEMSKKETTNETTTRTTEKETTKKVVPDRTIENVDRRSAHEQSYGGKLPGVFQTKPTGSTDQDQESTPPQDTDSERSNPDNKPEAETEQKK